MKKLLVILLVLLSLACAVSMVNAASCIIDEYGCTIIDEDGNRIYLMFWSEEARKYIMGDLSTPGTDVIDKPEGANAEFVFDSMDNVDVSCVNAARVLRKSYSYLVNPSVFFTSEEGCKAAVKSYEPQIPKIACYFSFVQDHYESAMAMSAQELDDALVANCGALN